MRTVTSHHVTLSHPTHSPADLLVANPFDQTVVAWVNGRCFRTSIKPPQITRRRPRTAFVTVHPMTDTAHTLHMHG